MQIFSILQEKFNFFYKKLQFSCILARLLRFYHHFFVFLYDWCA